MLERSRCCCDRSELLVDPLSDVLSLLKLRSYTSGGLDIGGDWSVAFARHDGIKVYAVVSGQCWLSVDGVDEVVLIGAGDCFLLPRGWPFRIASDLSLPPADPSTIFPAVAGGGITFHNGGGGVFLVGGHFALAGGPAGMLLAALPPILHLRDDAQKEALRWSIERMRQELREPQPGGFLVAQQLATMMLVQALRLYLADRSEGGVSWLSALADRQMASAIAAMHAAPSCRWTLQSLAERAGMSRTSFAVKFKATVGVSAMDYLTRWRMMVAGDRLRHSTDSVSTIALSLSYGSESAFGTAFKRVLGCSPRQYSRGHGRGPEIARNA